MGSPLVQIRREHRADALSSAVLPGPSRFVAVIDVRPAVVPGEVASPADTDKCARCSYVQFLESRPDLGQFSGLTETRDFFRQEARFADALASRSAARLREAAERIRGRVAFEVVPWGAPRELVGVPALHVLDAGAPADAGLTTTSGDQCLVVPGRAGPLWALAQIESVRRTGFSGAISLGYTDHATASADWDEFITRPAFEDEWRYLLEGAAQLGLPGLGLMMALSPCSSLAWRANQVLERIRARLDLHFRGIEGESSMMCAENVSGYGLVGELQDFLRGRARTAIPVHMALRYDRVILQW